MDIVKTINEYLESIDESCCPEELDLLVEEFLDSIEEDVINLNPRDYSHSNIFQQVKSKSTSLSKNVKNTGYTSGFKGRMGYTGAKFASKEARKEALKGASKIFGKTLARDALVGGLAAARGTAYVAGALGVAWTAQKIFDKISSAIRKRQDIDYKKCLDTAKDFIDKSICVAESAIKFMEVKESALEALKGRCKTSRTPKRCENGINREIRDIRHRVSLRKSHLKNLYKKKHEKHYRNK
jgi:hypothetical protein